MISFFVYLREWNFIARTLRFSSLNSEKGAIFFRKDVRFERFSSLITAGPLDNYMSPPEADLSKSDFGEPNWKRTRPRFNFRMNVN